MTAFYFPLKKTSKYALKPEEAVKNLLLCLLPLYDPQWAFVFSPTSTPSLDKQSCIRRPFCNMLKFKKLKFSLILSLLLTKKYDLKLKLIFVFLLCSKFLSADAVIYKKFDFHYCPEKVEFYTTRRPLNAGLGIYTEYMILN